MYKNKLNKNEHITIALDLRTWPS